MTVAKFEVLPQHFPTGTNENDYKPLTRQPAFRFESRTFRYGRSVNHSTVALSCKAQKSSNDGKYVS